MNLINLIYPKYSIISIVGTYKNAGKTVTMNEIILQAADKEIMLGLVSTGRDGERRDVLTNTEKPPVYVKRGTIITTLENAVRNEFVQIEVLMVTDYSTALGRVIIGRAIDEGYVEISGPTSAASIKEVCDIMMSFGAELVLIDGSLDRRASAAPYVSQGTILATGAALARNMDTVIQKTLHIVDTYRVPALEDAKVRSLARKMIDAGKTGIIDRERNIKYIDTATSLHCGELISTHMDESVDFIVLSGSATVSTISDILLNKKSDFEIIVKDPTRIFIPKREFMIFQNRGLKLRVVDGINIVAMTVNPYSPEGYYFDPAGFLDRMRESMAGKVPVFDVMQGWR